MDNKLNDIRKKLRSSFQHPDQGGAFEQEAAEGWKAAGNEKWEEIMSRLDKRIDNQIIEPVQPASPKKPDHLLRKISSPLQIGIAATILLIIGLSIQLLLPKEHHGYQDLYAEYYKPLDAPEDVLKGEGENNTNNNAATEKIASALYDEMEFKESVAFYSELLAENPGNAKYTLFLGLSLMNIEEFDKAILLYNSYQSTQQSYDEDIRWYLALAHLRKGEINTSKAILENFSKNKNSYYHVTAQQLLARMEQIK